MSSNLYFAEVLKLMNKVRTLQSDKIKDVAKVFANAIKKDKLIHVFGTGHSHMIAEEMFVRAGGLAPVDAMLDPCITTTNGAQKSGKIEKLEGLAEIIWEQYDIDKEDIMVIISNSGRNSVPIEMAQKAKSFGLFLIAITSIEHSNNCKSRHSSGLRLFELADIVIDTCIPTGDSLLMIGGTKTGPASTLSGVIIVNAILCETLVLLNEWGITLPVYGSQNVDGFDNDSLYRRYGKRIRHI